ncbi:SCP2 sterol-binding domain-containing protein [Nocardia inohanensis]|uniref:SCP2 sterol-binding domain-containing protein n=1 Tax=Nocardia inohanensis TaxID=209246 RepID=UPI000836C392|nr:SCP2 sterol-binding domain-containing protein [Nocardia inohanensis]
MRTEALTEAIALATATGKATAAQIEDLLSGERPRVRSVVEVMAESDLRWALGTDLGEQALLNAFELMPAYYVPGEFTAPVIVRYRVTRAPGEPVGRDVVFGPDYCRVGPVDPSTEPELSVFVDALGFVRVATGLVKGMELLMRGELKLQGNVQVAMKTESFFGLSTAAKS